jgi:serine/threonine-protein kinase PpkA
MVVVPAGEFMMGSEAYGNERPAHKVTIARPVAVSRFSVRFDQWDGCVAHQGGYFVACARRPGDEGWGRSSRPVINAS